LCYLARRSEAIQQHSVRQQRATIDIKMAQGNRCTIQKYQAHKSELMYKQWLAAALEKINHHLHEQRL